MTTTKPMRRDKVQRMAAADKLVKVQSYSFDDSYGESRSTKELPVRIIADNSEWKDGFCNLRSSDFRSKSGCCYENADGTITLIVHSNCSMTFRVKN